jgi:hypothetical protein
MDFKNRHRSWGGFFSLLLEPFLHTVTDAATNFPAPTGSQNCSLLVI